MAKNEADAIEVGTVVRDRTWGGRYTGAVVRTEGRSLFVAWHRSFVVDELDVNEVEIVAGAPEQLHDWRGGIGVLHADGSSTLEPLTGR